MPLAVRLIVVGLRLRWRRIIGRGILLGSIGRRRWRIAVPLLLLRITVLLLRRIALLRIRWRPIRLLAVLLLLRRPILLLWTGIAVRIRRIRVGVGIVRV